MRRLIGYSCCLVLASAGCGQDGLGKTVPVTGRVRFDGRPLEAGTVIFRPDATRGNTSGHEARGTIDKDGTYHLAVTVGKKKKPGAPAGWYQVGVVSVQDPGERPQAVRGMPPPPRSVIPLRYNDPAGSGLSIEVKENASPGSYNLELSR